MKVIEKFMEPLNNPQNNNHYNTENHPSRELSKQMGYKRMGVEKDF